MGSTGYRDMTKEELVGLLEQRSELAHELEVHQSELEMQNHELREAQQQLEVSRSLYADLYDFAPIAYITLDEAGCIVQINLAGAALLRRERGMLIGTPFAALLDADDRAPLRKHISDCVCGKVSSLQLEINDHVVRVASGASRDLATGAWRCRMVLFDVTEERRAELAIRMSLRMREDFLAIVSHELRNPLNAIAMGTEVLLHGTPGEDRRQRARTQLESMQRATARMDRLLADLLDLSSMDAGQLAMRIGEHSIGEIVDAAIEAVTPAARAKGVRLVDDVTSDGLLSCDRDRIVQVLVNLAGNAVKFTAADGTVAIRAKESGDTVELSVTDDGIGIGEAQQAQIFAPYWQVDRRAKRGTGLGLSIARGIVECHGGGIAVHSRLGEGSTFSVTLDKNAPKPVDASDLVRRPSTLKRTLARAAQTLGTVLVVDDDFDTRELLSDLLRHEGYTVSAARGGAEALETLARDPAAVSVILLDFVMPGIDGWQFLDRRAADPRLARIPVILISGQANASETSASLGLDGSVEKPINLERLRRALARVAASARSPGASISP